MSGLFSAALMRLTNLLYSTAGASNVGNNTAGGSAGTTVQAAMDLKISTATANATFATLTGLAQAMPSGAVLPFAMSAAPAGWLKANGALVSRTTYAALFAAIGTTFGVGDGVTTFALPDLRGEFMRGFDDGRGVDISRVLGSLQLDASQGHTHTVNQATLWGNYSGGASPYYAGTTAAANSSSPAANYGISLGVEITDGANGVPRIAAETRPRNIALLICIKY